jgi:chorismate-pyruvate lyase
MTETLRRNREELRLGFLTSLTSVDTGALGLLQRIFLVCDGTLTDTLQAAVQEPISVVKLATESSIATVPIEDLALSPGEPILTRRVLLRGRDSERCYVYAESLIALSRVPPCFQQELMHSDKPLGRLWTEYKLESRKELLGVSQVVSDRLARHFGIDDDSHILVRRYRLASGGQPIMLISESFPVCYSPDILSPRDTLFVGCSSRAGFDSDLSGARPGSG